MARKPENFEWIGFTAEQRALLETLDFIGNNGWSRNSQTEVMMPNLLQKFEQENVSIDEVVQAMRDIGYRKENLHQLRRWESKRLTGKFGR